jgi:competence protein ComEA
MDAPKPPPTPSPAVSAPSWPRSLELALTFILGGCAVLVLQGLWQKWGSTGHPATAKPVPGLDLNRAEARELAQVPGLGPKRAKKIVDHRETHGPFKEEEDVSQVKGIGSRTAERVRKHVQSGTAPTEEEPASTAAPRGRKSEPTSPIDINRATSADLQKIPGIGPVLAQRILDHRAEHGPFLDVKGLMKVKGIKEKTLEKMLPYVRVGQETTAMKP